jgi:hypothetical protein
MQSQLMCRPLGGALAGYHKVRPSYGNCPNLLPDGFVWHVSDDHHAVLFRMDTFKF